VLCEDLTKTNKKTRTEKSKKFKTAFEKPAKIYNFFE
jgi:hypothetical protein